jgi:hypothetical protein
LDTLIQWLNDNPGPTAIISALLSGTALPALAGLLKDFWKGAAGNREGRPVRSAVNLRRRALIALVVGVVVFLLLHIREFREGTQPQLTPNLLHLPESTAIARLERSGLPMDIRCMPAEGVATPGTVYATTPAAGTIIDPNSKVRIYIAPPCDYAPLIRIPHPLGNTPAEAVSTLTATGLNGETACKSTDRVESGRAFDASPVPGTRVKQGSLVTVYINC